MTPLAVESGGVSWARVGRSRLLSRVGLASVLFAMTSLNLAAAALDGAVMGTVFGALGVAWTVALLSFIVSYALWFTRTPRPGGLVVDDRTVHVRQGQKTTALDRARVASAYLVRRPVGDGEVATAEIVLDDGDVIALRTSGIEEAQAIVARLGFGPGGRRVEIGLTTPARRLLHVLLGLVAYYASSIAAVPVALFAAETGRLPWWGGLAVAPVMLGLYALFKRLARPATVTIGDDGFALTSGTRTRYVPRAAIRGVQVGPLAIIPFVHTREGVVALSGASLDVPRAAAAAMILHDRLVAPRAAAADRSAIFERGGRPIAEWRAAIRRALEDAGYRAAGASADDASAVLRSAAATPEQRVGAALALRAVGRGDQIRVATESIADERLRVAVEAAADDEDTKIDAALARVLR